MARIASEKKAPAPAPEAPAAPETPIAHGVHPHPEAPGVQAADKNPTAYHGGGHVNAPLQHVVPPTEAVPPRPSWLNGDGR